MGCRGPRDAGAEALLHARPDVACGRFGKGALVGRQREQVHLLVLQKLIAAATRLGVVQETAQHLLAQALVRLRLRQVLVPGQVDVMRRTDGLPAGLRQVEEAPVLGRDGLRMAQGPAVFVGQPGLEAQLRLGVRELEALDALVQLVFRCGAVHGRFPSVAVFIFSTLA